MMMLGSRVSFPKTNNKCFSTRKFSSLPLTEPLPNVPKQNEPNFTSPVVKSSNLSNGVRLFTFSSKSSPISSIGIFIQNGSRYEDASTLGSSLFLKHLAFEKTKGRSALNIVRGFESLGANFVSSVGREHLSFSASVTNDKTNDLLPILSDVLHPQIEDYILVEEKKRLKESAESSLSNPSVFVLEQLHAVAFKNKGLGLPLYPLHNLEYLDVKTLEHFSAQNTSANRLVIVAVGDINHEQFEEKAKQYFSNLTTQPHTKPTSEYVGGDSGVWSHGNESHVAIGFSGSGWTDKDLPALTVLQYILGSGKSYVKDGPGIGLTSRFNRNIVEKSNGDIHQLSTFHFPYSDAGLFGVYGVSNSGNASQLVEKVTKEFSSLHNGAIDATELNRAKAHLKGDILFGAQSNSSISEFVGIHALAKDKITSPSDFVKVVDSVTVEDVKNVAKRVFKSKPSISSLGNISSVPSREQVQSSLA